jgi:hypothetical protein
MPSIVAQDMEAEVPKQSPLFNDDRWLLVQRIAASPAFARSLRLSRLLLYICEQGILGRTALLTEQGIAAEVFDRRSNFDPSADTIVRSHLLRLRQKLEAYFHEEGAQERLRISIPRGGYVPVFEEIEDIETIVPVEPLYQAEAAEAQGGADLSRLRTVQRYLIVACTLLCVLSLALLAMFLSAKGSAWRGAEIIVHSPRHALWRQLFSPGRETILVAADSGIVMLHGITQRNSSLSEYMSRDFSREIDAAKTMSPGEISFFANRRYTSYVDLETFDKLTHLPEALPKNYTLRYARDISANDLKQSNVILSGSQDADPWIELFELQMNFVLHNDLSRDIRSFANRSPKTGEQDSYVCGQFEYGVLAFLPNLTNTGNVLIAEGTSVAGTEAIGDFLFGDRALDSFLKTIARSDGSIPHFEILLKSKDLNGSASRSQIVAYRVQQ